MYDSKYIENLVSEPMRITVLTSSYPRFPGDGTAPFVRSISEHLVELGHDVEVVAPYDAAVRGSLDQNIPVHRFHYTLRDQWHIMGHSRSLASDIRLRAGVFFLLPPFLAAYFRASLQVAGGQQADIIHAHWVLPNGLVGAWVARALDIPLAVSLHGSDVFVARRNPIFGLVARWVFRQAAVVTACSENLRQGALELGATRDKIRLVAWGADPTRFHPTVPPLKRSNFQLTDEDLVLVSLGRVVPKKGFDVLVRALPSLLSICPRAHLLIGGDGPERDALLQRATDLGVSSHVHLPGEISWEQVPRFLAMGDVFVLPSVRDAAGNIDGLPTVLLEAMAAGKPVVATTIGGVPLVVEHRVNGVLCRPGDPDALTQAIGQLIGDASLRARLGGAARTSVEERLNWRAVTCSITSLFASVTPA
ncbi:MAG: glycosyltransferase [bacterium]